jgi:hypothetical protein
MKRAAAAGRQENSKQLHLTNFFTVQLEGINKHFSQKVK